MSTFPRRVGNRKGPNRRPCRPPEGRLFRAVYPSSLILLWDVFQTSLCILSVMNTTSVLFRRSGWRSGPHPSPLPHGSCCGGDALDDHSTDANKRDKREGETDDLGCHRRQARSQALASYRQVRAWTPDQWRLPNVFRHRLKIKAPLRYCTSEPKHSEYGHFILFQNSKKSIFCV